MSSTLVGVLAPVVFTVTLTLDGVDGAVATDDGTLDDVLLAAVFTGALRLVEVDELAGTDDVTVTAGAGTIAGRGASDDIAA
ncbi:MAG: hypothetical protein FD127_1600 [Acidimicrobiaceae bacterium]|nr:MAG: hypothetical protein FD127_1600 [Acidimicrobiaceae bacterium]